MYQILPSVALVCPYLTRHLLAFSLQALRRAEPFLTGFSGVAWRMRCEASTASYGTLQLDD